MGVKGGRTSRRLAFEMSKPGFIFMVMEGDYKSALRKLDEILQINPNEKTVQYFKEKYTKYKTKFEWT